MNGGVLEGKTALVTGAASGLGLAVATAFVESGARVVVLDRDVVWARSAADDLGAVAGVGADVADEDQVIAGVAEVDTLLGRIDVLVNAAGLLTQSPLVEMPLTQWQETINVDLTGVFLLCRHVVPGMVARRDGRVINSPRISPSRGASR